MQVVKQSILTSVFRVRKPTAHKGNFGHLAVLGGSKQYTGSAAFVALAALRMGVDLVTVAAPQRAADVIASYAPDLITWPLEGEWIGLKHFTELKEICTHATAVVLGNGMSSYFETERVKKERIQLVRKLLLGLTIPVVLDAEGIRAIIPDPSNRSWVSTGHPSATDPLVRGGQGRVVFTPHVVEFEVLTGVSVKSLSNRERAGVVMEQARRLNSIILLKGHEDVISDGKRVVINTTGNPYMTKGGTGDVLAGVVGSFLAQGIEPYIAAQAAAFLVGRAGDRVAKVKKQALLASDIINELGDV